MLVHFTDHDIESGAVIRAFLDEIYDPPPLGRRVALDVYLPLAHFLAKYACPTVELKLGRRMVDGLVSKRVRPLSVWLVFAAFREWRLCEGILLFTVIKLRDSNPARGWQMPRRLEMFVPWPYLAALSQEKEDNGSAVAVRGSSPTSGAVNSVPTPTPTKQSYKVWRREKITRAAAEAVGKRARVAVAQRQTLVSISQRTLRWVAETSMVQEWDVGSQDNPLVNSKDE